MEEGRARELDAALESMAEAVLLFDRDGRILRMNHAAEELYAYTPEERRMSAAERFARLELRDSRGRPLALESSALHRAARGETVRNDLCRFPHRRSGRMIWTSSNAVPIRGDDGEVTGVILTATDITRQKELEDQREQLLADLSAERSLLKAIIDNAPEAIVVADEQARVVLTNRAAIRLTARPVPIGRPFAELEQLKFCYPDGSPCPPRELPLVRAALDGLSLPQQELMIVWPDGQERHIISNSAPIRDGGGRLSGSVFMYQDVTSLQRMERLQRENEKLFRSWFEMPLVGAALISPAGRWLRVNQKLCQDLGYSREELLDRTWMDITPPEDLEEDLKDFQTLLAGTQESFNREKRCLRGNGTPISLFVSMRVVRRGDGSVDYLVAVIQDLTGWKKLEAQFIQAQKMESIGRLAGGIAHDFNNLLTVILGNAELGLEGSAPAAPLREVFNEIKRAGERAGELTRKLLAFSRRQLSEPRLVELNGLIGEMQRMLQRLVGEQIELDSRLEAGLPLVRIDPGQVEQVLTNLVVNARDAMPSGGRITVETATAELDEECCRYRPEMGPGRYVVLAVSDTGVGMDAETRSHLFEPFFTTKPKGIGTGLGLSTCYGIVKQNGGYIWVYSEPGQGTTVKIYFPVAGEASDLPGAERRQAGGTAAAVPAAANLPRGTETVLVVEDEPAILKTAARVLAGCGYQVLTAARAEQALAIAEGHDGPIELLLTDVVMPGVGGRELAGRLAARRPELKVLYMSGYTGDTIVRHGTLEAGLWFLPKPFSSASLAQKVRQVLDSAPQQAEDR